MCNACRCDYGYELPEMTVIHHEVRSNHEIAVSDKDGQLRMFRNAALGVVDAAREKRESLPERLAEMKRILDESPEDHFILWHDLEAERHSIEALHLPSYASVYGNQPLDERERAIIDFSEGRLQYLGGKPEMIGSGTNLQRHCHKAIFLGIGFKAHDFIQAIHRIHRFLQDRPVEIHLIYSESEREVLKVLMQKWERHKEQVQTMTEIIRTYGLSELALAQALTRSIGVERTEVQGERFRLINNDSVEECARMEENSVGLILSSIPFNSQYEYSANYNDFGHSESNEQFFGQMDYLTPHLFRALQPGRIAAIHVKDRIVPGGINGFGFQSVYPFHADCIDHFQKHGFVFLGMKTIVTDVVRENNQTYRLGWTEQCKDATKMGYGLPEYLLVFRKPQSDRSRSYADIPVIKSKSDYTRSRWQIDAHGFMRSSGNRPLMPEDLDGLPHATIFKLFRKYSLSQVYDFEHHVKLSEALERCAHCRHIHVGTKKCGTPGCDCTIQGGRLPVTFMLLQTASWHPDVWTDITRMRTLNGSQWSKGKELHLCPLQFDIAERVITQMSNPGDVVLDPFSGLGTVPMCAIQLGRRGVGVELNSRYFADSVGYCQAAEKQSGVPTLFDLVEAQESGEVDEFVTEELSA